MLLLLMVRGLMLEKLVMVKRMIKRRVVGVMLVVSVGFKDFMAWLIDGYKETFIQLLQQSIVVIWCDHVGLRFIC